MYPFYSIALFEIDRYEDLTAVVDDNLPSLIARKTLLTGIFLQHREDLPFDAHRKLTG